MPRADTEQAAGAKQARAAASVVPKEITRNRARFEKSITAIDAALAVHQVGTAQQVVDGLSGWFAPRDSDDLAPDAKADAETRTALFTVSNLLARYQQLKRAFDANEMLVSGAGFNILWDPKNGRKDEDQLYANVRRRHALTGAEVQALYRRNEREADRRLKAHGDAESHSLQRR